LYFLGGCSDVSEKLVHFVGQLCETVTASTPVFEVTFDRTISFRGGPDNRPFVLIDHSNGNLELMKLRQALDTKFSKYQRRSGGNSFNPHVTLLYDQQSLPEEPINPISWMVGELALVRSEVGATKYEKLGSWKLTG
jgi:2'-5' RNA ligase